MELGKQRGKDGKTRSDTKHYFSIGTGKNRKHFQSNFYIYLPSENVTVVLHFDSIIFFSLKKSTSQFLVLFIKFQNSTI